MHFSKKTNTWPIGPWQKVFSIACHQRSTNRNHGRYDLTPERIAIFKRPETSGGEGVEMKGRQYAGGRNVDWPSPCGDQQGGFSSYYTYGSIVWSSNSIPRCLPEMHKIQRDVYPPVCIMRPCCENNLNSQGWVRKMGSLTVTADDVLPCVQTWMELEDIIPSQISQKEREECGMVSVLRKMQRNKASDNSNH